MLAICSVLFRIGLLKDEPQIEDQVDGLRALRVDHLYQAAFRTEAKVAAIV
jgi:hypothetical protein